MSPPRRASAVRKTKVVEPVIPRFLKVAADYAPPGMEAMAALIQVASGRATAPSSGVESTDAERICSSVLTDVLTGLPKEGAPFHGRDGWLAVTLTVGTALPRACRRPIYNFLFDQLKRFDDGPIEEARILVASDAPFTVGIQAEWMPEPSVIKPSNAHIKILTTYQELIHYSWMTRGAKPGQQQNDDLREAVDGGGLRLPKRPELPGLEVLRRGEEECEGLHKVTVKRFKKLLHDLDGFEGTSKEERQDVAKRVTRQAHRLGLVLRYPDETGRLVPVTIRCRRQSFEIRKSGGNPIETRQFFPRLEVISREELTSEIYR